jgi:hypothetical protein
MHPLRPHLAILLPHMLHRFSGLECSLIILPSGMVGIGGTPLFGGLHGRRYSSLNLQPLFSSNGASVQHRAPIPNRLRLILGLTHHVPWSLYMQFTLIIIIMILYHTILYSVNWWGHRRLELGSRGLRVHRFTMLSYNPLVWWDVRDSNSQPTG